jgi:lysophospholipase L1-like esterase
MIRYLLFASLAFNLFLVTFFAIRKFKYFFPGKILNYEYSAARNHLFEVMPHRDKAIIFVGDSQTQFFPLDELFQGNILNRGISGDVSGGVLNRLEEITRRKPTKLFIQVGINDISRSVPVSTITQNYTAILQQVKNQSPVTKIYVQSVLPYGPSNKKVQELNPLLKELAIREKVTYIDLYSPFVENNRLRSTYDCGDGLHLSGEGYLLWRDIVSSYVAE